MSEPHITRQSAPLHSFRHVHITRVRWLRAQRPWLPVHFSPAWSTDSANHGAAQARQRRGCSKTSSHMIPATKSELAGTSSPRRRRITTQVDPPLPLYPTETADTPSSPKMSSPCCPRRKRSPHSPPYTKSPRTVRSVGGTLMSW